MHDKIIWSYNMHQDKKFKFAQCDQRNLFTLLSYFMAECFERLLSLS